MKPQTGLWMGSLQIRGQNVNLPIRIHLDQVGEDGSLTGRFEFSTRADDWVGPDGGAFNSGSYSQAGTIRFEQPNVAKSIHSGSVLSFDGKFDTNTEEEGVMWGPFTVKSSQGSKSEDQESYSGILVASHLEDRAVSKARYGAWN